MRTDLSNERSTAVVGNVTRAPQSEDVARERKGAQATWCDWGVDLENLAGSLQTSQSFRLEGEKCILDVDSVREIVPWH